MQRVLTVLVVMMIIFSLSLGNSIAAEKAKGKKEKIKTSQQKQAQMKKEPVEKYDLNPFNLFRTTLPKNYMGHDLKGILKALEEALRKREENDRKDEFETTEQYKQRIKTNVDIDHKKLIGKLTMNDIFSFVVIPEPEYDADSKTLALIVNTTAVRGLDEGDKPRVGIEVDLEGKTRTYMGSNAYGASREIKELEATYTVLAISNISALPNIDDKNREEMMFTKVEHTLNNIFRGLPTSEEDKVSPIIKLDIENITPEIAKVIKNNLNIAFISMLEKPYISSGIYKHEPTIDEPHDDSIFYQNVLASVKEIWVYNKANGEILLKVNTEDVKSGDGEIEY